MKKILFLLVCMFSFSVVVFAGDDKPVNFQKLPVRAQKFINTHFTAAKVQKAFMDESGDEYEVRIKGGIKIEFDEEGRWKEIETSKAPIPGKLIPTKIRREVKTKYGATIKIVEISREDDKLEVKLSNGKELEFDRSKKKVEEDD